MLCMFLSFLTDSILRIGIGFIVALRLKRTTQAPIESHPLSRDGHIVRTENSQKVELERQKNIFLTLFVWKLLQIWRDLVESFSRHILDLPDSQKIFGKKFEQVGGIPEISLLGNRKINEIQRILFMKTKVLTQFWETENRDDNIVRA